MSRRKTGVNVKLEVPSGEANEQITLMMTSGKLPDLISMGSWETAVKKSCGKAIMSMRSMNWPISTIPTSSRSPETVR
ncbi:hypothetical protein ACFTAO_17135 [Paenibacillus rhizoplanae]